MPSSNTRSYSKPRRWLYSVIITLILLTLLETTLYLSGVPSQLGDSDPFVGFSSRSPMFVRQNNANGEDQMQLSSVKKHWFNPVNFPVIKQPDSYRIFCLGGSTTFGRPYDQRTAFCGWLQALLQQVAGHIDWQVINLGGVSYASYRVAAMMQELGNYQPDMFIAYIGHNEFLEERSYRDIATMPEWLRDLNLELSRSRIYSVMKRTLDRLKSSGKKDVTTSLDSEVKDILRSTVGPQSYQRDDEHAAAVLTHYRFNLKRIIRIARSFGSDVVLVKPASRLRDESPFKSEHRESLNKIELKLWNESYQLGLHSLDSGNYDKALQHFETALQLDDRYAELHYQHARALFSLQRYRLARAAFQRSIDEDIASLRMTSHLQMTLDNVAAETQTTLVDFPSIISKLSNQQLGHDLPAAEMFMDHVHPTIELHKMLALELVETLREKGIIGPNDRLSDADITQVSNRIQASLDPQIQQQSLLNLAKVLGWSGKLEQAHALLLRSQDEFGDNQQTLHLLSISSERRGHLKQAIDYAQKAVELYPQHFNARYSLAMILQQNQQADAAIATYREALDLDPGSLAAHEKLVYLLIEQGRRSEAVQQLELVRKLDPGNVEVLINLGILNSELGRFDQAELFYHLALEYDSNHAQANYALAVLYNRQQQNERAVEYFLKAIALEPDNPEIANDLGVLYAQTGKLKQAIRQFQQALKIRPEYDEARRNLAIAQSQ